MATFKCRSTGNTVDFDLEWDITQMRAHPDYVEVEQEIKQEEKPAKKTAVKSKEA